MNRGPRPRLAFASEDGLRAADPESLEARSAFRRGEALGLVLGEAVTHACAANWAAGVHAAREHWNHDFGGAQFSLGRAWYTHLEEGRAQAYFHDVAGSDARVERHCPGLQARMRELLAVVVGEPVRARPDWCGPGVHVFPAGCHVAQNGGDVHFDLEGLPPSHARQRLPALTAVLMLSSPASGGGLRMWDVLCEDGIEGHEDEDLAQPSLTFHYRPGDLLVIDSYRLHQIQPFGGNRARVSATCHAARIADGWESWF